MSDKQNNEKYTHLFAGLVSSIASQAWMQLGKIKNPMTDKIEKDLAGASMSIDMLDMLKHISNGNLNEQEVKFIDQSLHDLRMNYVVESNKKDEPEESPKDATDSTETPKEETETTNE
jgi:hypothetical protein